MQRLDAFQESPDIMQSLLAIEKKLSGSGMDRNLVELVRLRSSQLNGCTYCVDMHAREASQHGEMMQRINLVSVWRESSLFSDLERAVLAWTESLTRNPGQQGTDDAFDELATHLSPGEIVNLTLIIGMINLWNRLGVACRWQHPVDRAEMA
ncbi:carboxymuconolactone decarboxylase family protein [Sphingopyxis sp.]|uniref:carboxymuconolactone decarboxylase family protein n=1 Tax=Sphingopyxis sp. TaxID=1908224 RepID=UPI003D6CEB2D